MKKTKLFALSLFAALTFTACSSDDDPSFEDQYKNVTDNYTDLLGGYLNQGDYNYLRTGGPVYGQVKTIEETSYRAEWDSATNSPKKLYLDYSIAYSGCKSISEYNRSGFLTSVKTFEFNTVSNLKDRELRLSTVTNYTLDGRNRAIESTTTKYVYQNPIDVNSSSNYISQTVTTTYDDNKKTALVVTKYKYNESAEFTITKNEYELLNNGRIDASSYINYQKATTENPDDYNKPSYGNSTETVRDNHNNWTIGYQINRSYAIKLTSINGYRERTITYY